MGEVQTVLSGIEYRSYTVTEIV